MGTHISLFIVIVLVGLGQIASTSEVLEIQQDSDLGDAVAEGYPVIAMFYAPWCGHCKALKPVFANAAADSAWESQALDDLWAKKSEHAVDSIGPHASFMRVNCEAHKGLCEQHGVKGYPSVLAARPAAPCASSDTNDAMGQSNCGPSSSPVFRKFRGARGRAQLVALATALRRRPVAALSSGDSLAAVARDESVAAAQRAAHVLRNRAKKEKSKSGQAKRESNLADQASAGQAPAVVALVTGDSAAQLEQASGGKFRSVRGAASRALVEALREWTNSDEGSFGLAAVVGARPADGQGVAPPPPPSVEHARGLHTEATAVDWAAVHEAVATAGAILVRAQWGSGFLPRRSGELVGKVDEDALHGGARLRRPGRDIPAGRGQSVSIPRLPPQESPALQWTEVVVDAFEVPQVNGTFDASYVPQAAPRWLKRATLPLVVRTDAHSFSPLVGTGSLLAMGVVSTATKRSAAAAVRATTWLASLASPHSSHLEASVRERFAFGILDAAEYADFVSEYNISAGELASGLSPPRLLVVDPQSKVFYEDSTVREREDFETFLKDVAAGLHPAQRSGVWRLPQRVWNAVWFGGPTERWVAIAVGLVLVAGCIGVGWAVCCPGGKEGTGAVNDGRADGGGETGEQGASHGGEDPMEEMWRSGRVPPMDEQDEDQEVGDDAVGGAIGGEEEDNQGGVEDEQEAMGESEGEQGHGSEPVGMAVAGDRDDPQLANAEIDDHINCNQEDGEEDGWVEAGGGLRQRRGQ